MCRFLIAAVLCFAASEGAPGHGPDRPALRHSPEWVRGRFKQMMAVDDAYLWHDVLKGRAIHQNSSADPPTVPLEGNFHTQQQAFFALMKMHAHDVLKPRDGRLLDEARVLLDWCLDNGYDEERGVFYFCYNTKEKAWKKNFYPEFNMITVAALIRYDSIRPTPRYREAADKVFDAILRVGWDSEHGGFMSGFAYDTEEDRFTGGGDKGLYGAGYLAIMMLDAHDACGEVRFLEWARKAVDCCNEHLWDAEHGAWFPSVNRTWERTIGSTKLTHIIADMAQANYALYLRGCGDAYLRYAEEAMAFLAAHCRSPQGMWYRHTNRDGSDPKPGPDLEADGGTGTCLPYDRQMQVVAACCLGYRATRNSKYLEHIDATLAGMEKHHLIEYPAGVNYGYMGKDGCENTWCHLWGLKGFLSVMRLQGELSGR